MTRLNSNPFRVLKLLLFWLLVTGEYISNRCNNSFLLKYSNAKAKKCKEGTIGWCVSMRRIRVLIHHNDNGVDWWWWQRSGGEVGAAAGWSSGESCSVLRRCGGGWCCGRPPPLSWSAARWILGSSAKSAAIRLLLYPPLHRYC